MLLTALRLPGNIEGRLAELQARLFRERGMLSARALPPLVPLLWSRRPPDLYAVDPAPLPPMTIGGPAFRATGVVVELSPPGPLPALTERLEKAAAERGNEPADAPFSLGAPAILLAPLRPGDAAAAAAAADAAAADAAAGAAAVRETVVRSFTLVVVDVLLWEGDGPERVAWEEIARRRLRKQPE
ncbi:MAG: hypothetical protein ACLFPO_11035 [Spirochaetaceae bacterium]